MSDYEAIYLGPIVSLPDHLNYMPDLSRHFMFGFNCLFLLVVFHAALPAQDNPSPGLALVVPVCIPCPPKRQTCFMPACLSLVNAKVPPIPTANRLLCFALLCFALCSVPPFQHVRTDNSRDGDIGTSTRNSHREWAPADTEEIYADIGETALPAKGTIWRSRECFQ